SSLPPGTYEISAEAPGFQPARTRIVVQTAQTADVPVRMQVAGTVEQVQVSAEAPPIDVADARIQGTISQMEMKDRPLQGRNFFGLQVLPPGLTRVSGDETVILEASRFVDGTNLSHLRVNGKRRKRRSKR